MLNFSINGNGKSVVFLHGFCESLQIWEEFIQPFENNFQSILIDLPGFGKSTFSYDSTKSIESVATEVQATLAFAGVKEAIIVGHSLGGYVALALAELFPSLVRGIGLINSTAFADTVEKQESRNKTIDFVERNGVKPFIEPFVPGLFFLKNRASLQDKIAKLTEIGLSTPKESIIALTVAMRDRKNRIQLIENADFPILFVIGKQDTAVSFDKSMEQASLAKTSIIALFDQAGHQSIFEKTNETRQVLKSFVELCHFMN